MRTVDVDGKVIISGHEVRESAGVIVPYSIVINGEPLHI